MKEVTNRIDITVKIQGDHGRKSEIDLKFMAPDPRRAKWRAVVGIANYFGYQIGEDRKIVAVAEFAEEK